ncbi:MAG: YidB family protein [Acidobacteriota bacterium]
MGFLDSLEGMAASAMTGSGNDNMKVAGGLMEALQNHPGGLGAVISNFQQNGLGGHVDAMQNGETPQMTPDQVQTGLSGTGLLESAAEKAGVSPEVAQTVMTTVLPMVMSHFVQNGAAPDQGALGGLLSKLL